jgi:hypothetical protein
MEPSSAYRKPPSRKFPMVASADHQLNAVEQSFRSRAHCALAGTGEDESYSSEARRPRMRSINNSISDLDFVRHSDGQRWMKPPITGAVIRLPDPSLIHDMDTIVNYFSSALPVGFAHPINEKGEKRTNYDQDLERDNRVLFQRAPISSCHRYAHDCSWTFPFPVDPKRSRSRK